MKLSAARNLMGILAAHLMATACAYGQPTANLTPEATVHQAFNAIAANRPEQLFDLMPASYQTEIEQVVIAFAGQTDAASWNRMRSMLGRVSRILDQQKDLMSTVMAKQMPHAENTDQVREAVTAASTLTGHLSGSPITDLDRLKEGRLRDLLATEGHALMKIMETIAQSSTSDATPPTMWTSMRDATVELLDTTEDSATVRAVTGAKTEEIELVQVEGRWIPADMAKDWAESISDMKKKIASMDPSSPAGQQQAVRTALMLNMADGFLAQIEKAQTEQDIDQIIGGMMMGLMGGFGGR